MKRMIALILCIGLLLCACDDTPGLPTGDPNESTAPAATVDFGGTETGMFTDRDLGQDWENAISIRLEGTNARCDSSAVAIDGGTVTICAGGVYLLTGQLSGSIVVKAGERDKVQLVLSGAAIHNETGAAICALEGDKLFVTLAENTENSLSCGESLDVFEGYEVDGALYSRCDLTLNGSGALNITAPGGHGVTTKDDLAVTGGVYTVTCASQALDANNSVRICGGSFTLDAGKDGIHAEYNEDASLGFVYLSGGEFDITAQGDGISASAWMQIVDGSYTLLCGGGWENGEQHSSGGWGEMGSGHRPGGWPRSGDSVQTADESTSMKGFKAGTGLLIEGGAFAVDTADDAFHSDVSLTINGGTFTIASGDDAVHAEDTLTTTACAMTITHCYEGLEAEYIYVRGGEFTMTCSDDGLNASGGTDYSGNGGRDQMFGGPGGGFGGSGSGAIEISGGRLTIYSGGDGLDSNGSLTISGGYTYVTNPSSGDVSVLDSQQSPVITGGTYIGLGISTMMAQTFSRESTQGVIACTVGNQSAGTEFSVTDGEGNVVIACTSEYAVVLMIVSSPGIVKGENYTVNAGTVSGTLEAS